MEFIDNTYRDVYNEFSQADSGTTRNYTRPNATPIAGTTAKVRVNLGALSSFILLELVIESF
jgi:hypothetical protein